MISVIGFDLTEKRGQQQAHPIAVFSSQMEYGFFNISLSTESNDYFAGRQFALAPQPDV